MSIPTPNNQRSTLNGQTEPISQARLEANRANAQKSTGPRTPEGKAVSSRNAMTHGLLARHIVPANDPVEDPRVFDLLVDELFRSFQPRDIFESLCINRVAACYWRLDRAQRYESQSIMDARLDNPACSGGFSPGLGLSEFQPPMLVMPSAPDFNKLLRYEQMINRELRWTLAQFRQHRAEFQTDDESNLDPASETQGAPASSLRSPISNLQSPPVNSPSTVNAQRSAANDSPPTENPSPPANPVAPPPRHSSTLSQPPLHSAPSPAPHYGRHSGAQNEPNSFKPKSAVGNPQSEKSTATASQPLGGHPGTT